jgi:hypothetical protein
MISSLHISVVAEAFQAGKEDSSGVFVDGIDPYDIPRKQKIVKSVTYKHTITGSSFIT